MKNNKTCPYINFSWHGTKLELYASQALFIPWTRELLISDIHIGKAEYFQLNGIPLTNNEDENNHLLLKQSYEEVKKNQLEIDRINSCLQRMSKLDLIINETNSPSPFAFPLLVERLNNTLSNETIEERVNKLIKSYEK